MVHAYHVIISAYGFWLPNDPRGSWSDFVRSWELFRFGPATKTESTRSVASRPHDIELRQRAKAALQHPPVRFSGHQALSVARGFGHMCEKSKVVIWACAIMPEHLQIRKSCPVRGRGRAGKSISTTRKRLIGQSATLNSIRSKRKSDDSIGRLSLHFTRNRVVRWTTAKRISHV
ncbi:hypothetical protein SAMN05421753_10212 [Planctomicrobium piriforme]|uniref:Uncharacterized protein n=1 Tax=Planctomicrobium piriforme TaxID=1576369 RepID=A0A1I3BZE3_9PLAN|nr:hypothetical protein SAMN05421753_10212 [Planctomicrobium piriforme]